MGGIRLGSAFIFGRGVLHRVLYFVVGLENLFARGGYAFRHSNPDLFVSEYLLPDRQVHLFHFTRPYWMGNRSRCCAAKIEHGMAHAQFGPDRMDGRHRTNSGEPHSRCGRIWPHQHELLPAGLLWSECL